MIEALFFDFDGTIVESGEIKTDAFREVFSDFDGEKVERLVDYHVKHGGLSRFEKFRYFYREILREGLSIELLDELGGRFSDIVFDKVIRAPLVSGFRGFAENYFKEVPCFIASGTPTSELREVVEAKKLSQYFREIAGSPPKKLQVVENFLDRYRFDPSNCAFFGDSGTDLDAAKHFDMKFVLIRNKDNENLENRSDEVWSDFREKEIRI